MEMGRETQGAMKAAEVDEGARKTEPETPSPLPELLRRVEGEYREMPGMSLTLSQAERLWGLDRGTCTFVLTTLIERRVLRQANEWRIPTRAGRLMRPVRRIQFVAAEHRKAHP